MVTATAIRPAACQRMGTVTGLSVEVRELQDGVWHAIAYPVGPRGRLLVGENPVAAEWRGPVHAPASVDLVSDRVRWQPHAVGFGRRPWLTATARAALYDLVDRAWNTYAGASE